MRKLILNKPLLTVAGDAIKGGDLKDLTMGEALAWLLMESPEGDTLRHYDLAVAVRKEECELQPGDFEYLKTFLKDKCASVAHKIKAPILRELIEQSK